MLNWCCPPSQHRREFTEALMLVLHRSLCLQRGNTFTYALVCCFWREKLCFLGTLFGMLQCDSQECLAAVLVTSQNKEHTVGDLTLWWTSSCPGEKICSDMVQLDQSTRHCNLHPHTGKSCYWHARAHTHTLCWLLPLNYVSASVLLSNMITFVLYGSNLSLWGRAAEFGWVERDHYDTYKPHKLKSLS